MNYTLFMNKVLKHTPLYIVILIVVFACRTILQTTDEQNLSSIYNPSSTTLHPVFNIYHTDEKSSLITAKIFPSELLFNKANEAGEYRAKIKISYELFEITDSRKDEILVDSAEHIYLLNLENADKRFFREIQTKAETGKEYLLRIYTTDLLRKTNVQAFFYVDKTSIFNNQNFQVRYKKSNNLVFDPKVINDRLFTIFYNKKDVDSIYIKYFKRTLDLPTPTFSTSSPLNVLRKPDSLWLLPFSDTITYMLSYEGMYHIQIDTSVFEGLTLFSFDKRFPKVSEAQQLADPLAYLVSSTAYKELQSSKNKKLAVDDFWLSTTEDIDRARELIRIYYNRVYFANYYFTTSKEGWKTDRGMIYIVYGQPNTLYKSFSQEKWIYYNKSKSSKITFIFNRGNSPFSNKEFILQRGENLNSHWREAVYAWRNGQVFTLDSKLY